MFKRLKIYIYQCLANALMKKLEHTKGAEKWERTFNIAWQFNSWCVSNDIYLK